MTDSGWQYPGGEPPSGSGPYGAPPPQPPQPPPSSPSGASWGQPGYGGPEPPPPPPQRSWPIVALVGAVVLLVAAIVGVVVTSDSGDDTATDDTTETTESSDTTEGDPDEPDGPSDPGAFVDDEGGYSLTMPDSWAYSSLHGDLSQVGSQMFPDDPAKADLAQQSASALPRAIIFYGVVADEVGDAFVTNVNVNVTSTPGAGDLSYDEFSSQVKQGIGTIGATVTADEPFTLAGTDGVRVEFDYDPSLGASGVQYSAVIDDQLWVVNFASADADGHTAEFDEIASSFEVTG